MRSFKLTSALLAAAALLALAVAGSASARAHHTIRTGLPGGNCGVSLNVAPRLITSGETALAFGQAKCPSAEAAGATVTLYQRVAGSPGYAVAGTTTTDAKGFYQLTTAPQTTNSVFYAAIGARRSINRALKVAALVTLTGPPESKSLFAGIKTGRRNAVTFSGTVSPPVVPGAASPAAGEIVVLQRENAIKGQEWHWIQRSVVNREGGFSMTHIFVAPGASDLRVLLRPSRRNVASPSNVLTYEISQAENPSLTIFSATNPIPFGGSTVISGVLAGAPNTTVTLSGHAAHNPFVTIATTKTDSAGNYSFLPQSPLTSMFYAVAGAGRNSAVLYEGVKYVLTSSVASTTVSSGSPVTFTGTVTPAETGHAIYLERQNVAGTGFHVIALGTVTAGGTYSISRNLYAPGTEVLRVKIPGDPEHGGAASAPYTITVTPLTASKIAPEPPNNSTLPPEGKV